MEMVKWIPKFASLLKRLKDSWMDILPTIDRYLFRKSEARRQNQSHADMACGSEERQSRVRNFSFRISRKQVKSGMLHR